MVWVSLLKKGGTPPSQLFRRELKAENMSFGGLGSKTRHISTLGLDRGLNFSRVRQGYEPPSSETTPHIFDSPKPPPIAPNPPKKPPNPPKIYKSTDFSALGHDRDLGFSRGHQGYKPPSSVTTPHIFDPPNRPKPPQNI